MIKVLAFDCWDTLFENENNYFQSLEPFAQKIGEDFKDYKFMKIFESYFMLESHDLLEIPINKLLVELKLKPTNQLITELKKILIKAINSPKPFPETVKILHFLKLKYRLGLITNTFVQSFQELEKVFSVNAYFDIILKSYETKILKPNFKIFEQLLLKLKVSKDEVIMIGDSLIDDVIAAENFGIKGILIDRKGKHPDYANRIQSLEELEKFL